MTPHPHTSNSNPTQWIILKSHEVGGVLVEERVWEGVKMQNEGLMVYEENVHHDFLLQDTYGLETAPYRDRD